MAKKIEITKPKDWERKDREYYLANNKEPLVYTVRARHSKRAPLLWFDEKLGHNREMRYATNMPSPFLDEQEGTATMGHIVFRNGVLNVPKNKESLQLFLHYHPLMMNNTIMMRDSVKKATNQLAWMEMEIEALNVAKQLDIEHAEAILRVEEGSSVSKLTSKEIKRDILLMARKNPQLFLELVQDDNVELRNIGIKAVEAEILKISDDQRNIMWASNGRKIMIVPFDENPYSALAAWFKTDEGMEVHKTIIKRLK